MNEEPVPISVKQRLLAMASLVKSGSTEVTLADEPMSKSKIWLVRTWLVFPVGYGLYHMTTAGLHGTIWLFIILAILIGLYVQLLVRYFRRGFYEPRFLRAISFGLATIVVTQIGIPFATIAAFHPGPESGIHLPIEWGWHIEAVTIESCLMTFALMAIVLKLRGKEVS